MVSEGQSTTKLWKGLELGLGSPVHLAPPPRRLGPPQTLIWAVICEQRRIPTHHRAVCYLEFFQKIPSPFILSAHLSEGSQGLLMEDWRLSFTRVNATPPHRLPQKWGGNHPRSDHVRVASADICSHAITDESLTARSHFCLPSWISVGIPQPQPRDTPATKENYGMLLSSLHRKQLSKPCHTKVDGDPGAAGIILDLLISSAREGLLSLPSRKAGESTS